ncbi:MAG: hypothetical protein ACRDSP_11145 [Pseudonocardiaceae bacterium]
MTSQQLGCAVPEVIALRRFDDDDEVAGWAMVIGKRVVAYVPERFGVIGTGLHNTYSSLDSANRLLRYAGLYLDTDQPEPPDDSAAH